MAKYPLALKLLGSGISSLSPLIPRLSAQAALLLFIRPRRFKTPDWESENLEGLKMRRSKQGLAYWVMENSGPTALLVHGWDGRGSQLSQIGRSLHQQGYKVVLLDGPAHGQSPGIETDLSHFSNHLTGFATELGGVDTLVAHSFGAAASVLALNKGLHSKNLIYLAGPNRFQMVLDRYCDLLRLGPKSRIHFQKALEWKLGLAAGDLVIGKLGKKLSVSCLIIHAPDDADIPYSDSVEIALQWKKARHIEAPGGAGHRKILRNKEVIRMILEYLKADSNSN